MYAELTSRRYSVHHGLPGVELLKSQQVLRLPGRIVTHKEIESRLPEDFQASIFAYSIPTRPDVLSKLKKDSTRYVGYGANVVKKAKQCNPDAVTALVVRPGGAIPTLADYVRLAIIAADAGFDWIVLGGGPFDRSTQEIWAKAIDASLHDGQKVTIIPCVDLNRNSAESDLVHFSKEYAAIFCHAAQWSDRQTMPKLARIRMFLANNPNPPWLGVIQVHPAGGTPKRLHGSITYFLHGFQAVMPAMAAYGGRGTTTPLSLANNWIWFGPRGKTYKRGQDGMPREPLVAWADLDLHNDDEIEAEDRMDGIRRIHDLVGVQAYARALRQYLVKPVIPDDSMHPLAVLDSEYDFLLKPLKAVSTQTPLQLAQ